MKNELKEQTKDFVQTELKFIAKCYLESANRVKYLDNEKANKEDFIEDLLSIGDYIDKIVRELRK